MANTGDMQLTIGELAARTGLSVSAIRFWEEKGLIETLRTRGGQRRFLRSDIRRLSFALIAQQLGFSLQQISRELAVLPQGRTPTAADWAKLSRGFRRQLDERIAAMERMRDRLDKNNRSGNQTKHKSALYNPGDRRGSEG